MCAVIDNLRKILLHFSNGKFIALSIYRIFVGFFAILITISDYAGSWMGEKMIAALKSAWISAAFTTASYIDGKWWTQGRVGCRGCARLRRSIFHFNLGNLRPLPIPFPRASCRLLVPYPSSFAASLATSRICVSPSFTPSCFPLFPCPSAPRLAFPSLSPHSLPPSPLISLFFASSPDDSVIAQSQIVLACEMSCVMITDGDPFKIASRSLVEQKWKIRGDPNCLPYSRTRWNSFAYRD